MIDLNPWQRGRLTGIGDDISGNSLFKFTSHQKEAEWSTGIALIHSSSLPFYQNLKQLTATSHGEEDEEDYQEDSYEDDCDKDNGEPDHNEDEKSDE